MNQTVKEGFVLNLLDLINRSLPMGCFIACYLKYSDDKEHFFIEFARSESAR